MSAPSPWHDGVQAALIGPPRSWSCVVTRPGLDRGQLARCPNEIWRLGLGGIGRRRAMGAIGVESQRCKLRGCQRADLTRIRSTRFVVREADQERGVNRELPHALVLFVREMHGLGVAHRRLGSCTINTAASCTRFRAGCSQEVPGRRAQSLAARLARWGGASCWRRAGCNVNTRHKH